MAWPGVLREGLDERTWNHADATRIANLIGVENARRVYGIERPIMRKQDPLSAEPPGGITSARRCAVTKR